MTGPPGVYRLRGKASDTRPRRYDSGVISFPPVAPGEPLVISASTFVTYRTCPDQAVARLRGRYPADTRRSFRGGLAHRVFARHLTSGEIAAADFAQVCREEIGMGLNAAVGRLGLRPSDLRGLIEEAAELYGRFKRFPDAGFRDAEVSLDVEPAPGVTLRGTVDAVFEDDGAVRLVDWKTGGLGAARHQLSFYAMCWALERDALPSTVEAVSVGTGERLEERPTVASVTDCAELVGDLVSRARSALAGGGHLARVAGPWCSYCPVSAECPEGSAAAAMAG